MLFHVRDGGIKGEGFGDIGTKEIKERRQGISFFPSRSFCGGREGCLLVLRWIITVDSGNRDQRTNPCITHLEESNPSPVSD